MTFSIPNLANPITDKIKQGDWGEAIKLLEQEFNETGRQETLLQVRDLRVKAGLESLHLENRSKPTPCPPMMEDPFPGQKNIIPEISASELDNQILAGSIRHHGALIVRNLFDKEFASEAAAGIDETLNATRTFYRSSNINNTEEGWSLKQDASSIGDAAAQFYPFPDMENYISVDDIHMMRSTGSVWTFLSPKIAQSLVQQFEQIGLRDLLTQYFDDEPCLSFLKSLLRRVQQSSQADWHQDGAFMGADIKSLNLWVSLSECGAGTSRAGMDLVPKRLDKVMPTGTNGAYFDWSISHKSVQEWFTDCAPVRPYFGKGDAIFFDHLNLHVTSYAEEFTDPRYAIETWFFAKNHNADNQIPVVW